MLIAYNKQALDKPSLLRNHFYYIEMQSYLELCWAKRCPLIEFIKSQATQDAEEVAEKETIEKENLNPTELEATPNSQPEFSALSYNVSLNYLSYSSRDF